MSGYVYAIECGGRIKLGYSENPERRFSKIASDAPFPCEMLGSWPGTTADELAVQNKFQSTRVHGEWFASTVELLSFITDNMVARTAPLARFKVREGDNALAIWRKTARKTMQECAAPLGVTQGTWHRWEVQKIVIPAERVRHVSSLTGISKEELRPDLFAEEVLS